jgi:hypothetical protein
VCGTPCCWAACLPAASAARLASAATALRTISTNSSCLQQAARDARWRAEWQLAGRPGRAQAAAATDGSGGRGGHAGGSWRRRAVRAARGVPWASCADGSASRLGRGPRWHWH